MRTKSEWRAWAQDRAQEIDFVAAGATVRSGLGEMLSQQSPSMVLVYLPMANEVDLEPLIREHGHHTYLLTRTPAAGPLTVHAYGSVREHHRYGFDQPVPDSPRVDVSDIDLALVPGLLFDKQGNRLGRGKGYFDELLRQLSGKTLVGVVPRRLVVRELPAEPHDVRMTHLATEESVSQVSEPTNR